MANFIIDADYSANHLKYADSYALARDAVAANTQSTGAGAVGQYNRSGQYEVYREFICFDLSDISPDSEITAASLKIYGTYDGSTTDFDITIVSGEYNKPVTTSDYDKLNSVSLGTLNTSGYSASGYNTITFNAAGIQYLNETARDKIYLGLRSSRDILGIMPSGLELVSFYGHYEDSKKPQLDITISDWPDYHFPEIPAFPDIGHADIGTYSIITNFITDMVMFGKMMVTGGDIMLVDWPAGGGGLTQDMMKYLKIGDETMREGSLVTVNATSCSNNSVFNPLGDLDGGSLHINASGSMECDNLYVLGNFLCSDADFVEFQSDIDDFVSYYKAYNVTDLPTTSEAIMHMSPATGDFLLKRRSSGGTLVIDYIVDYSEV